MLSIQDSLFISFQSSIGLQKCGYPTYMKYIQRISQLTNTSYACMLTTLNIMNIIALSLACILRKDKQVSRVTFDRRCFPEL